MDLTTCRTAFDDYVHETLAIGVYLGGSGVAAPVALAVHDDVEVRVVIANHPDGQRATASPGTPVQGVDLNDVRIHLTVSDPPSAGLVVPARAGDAFYRSGWDTTDAILTPGDLVADLYVHFQPHHPTFDLSTADVLDDFVITARAFAPGTFTVTAAARVTPRWRTVSNEATSPPATVEDAER
jgi:hypothetical protein